MNELIMMTNEEKKKIIEQFKKEQEEMEKFYKDVIENLKVNRNKGKLKPKR